MIMTFIYWATLLNKLIVVGIVIVAIVAFSALTYAGYVPGLSEFF